MNEQKELDAPMKALLKGLMMQVMPEEDKALYQELEESIKTSIDELIRRRPNTMIKPRVIASLVLSDIDAVLRAEVNEENAAKGVDPEDLESVANII